MSTPGYVIVSLNLFCLLPCLILLVAASRTRSELSRLFIWLVCLNMLGLVAESAEWIFEYNSSTASYYIVRIAYLSNYIAGCAKVFVFGEYLYVCINQNAAAGQNATARGDAAAGRKIFYAVWLCLAISLALLLLSYFNQMYARFDELNVYHAQETFYLSQIFPLLGLLLLFYASFRYSGHLPKKQLAALRWYFVMIFLCSAVFFIVSPDLVLLYIVGTLSQMILYINIQMDEAQQMELELVESRSAAMLSQIAPHFVLNALTGIGQLCRLDPLKAQEAILHFSRYFRGNVDSLSGSPLIPFSRELEHVRHYLWLETMRFEDKLRVCLADDAPDFLLPPLTIQPLVENAVRHGLSKKEGGGSVSVTVEEDSAFWRVLVADDGLGFNMDSLPPGSQVSQIRQASQNRQNRQSSPSRQNRQASRNAQSGPDSGHSHIGIANARSRLAALCNGRLTITSAPGQGTLALIEIPKAGPGK